MAEVMDKVRLLSPAKINLGLRILRKRPDGYHDIETVFYEIPLYDEIEIEISEQIEFETDSEGIPRGFDNLCLVAGRLFKESFGIHSGFKISLKKRIPVGAGLGGGSSNSAAVLKGLNKLFNANADEETLTEIASLIGSDVPFFIKGGTAYATGKGEILDFFELKLPYKIVVIYPGVKISTAWAYSMIKPRARAKSKSLKEIWLEHLNEPMKLKELVENDFEEVVFSVHPIVRDVKAKLYELGALFSLMSGSGSAVYGLFEDVGEELKQKLSENFPTAKIFLLNQ